MNRNRLEEFLAYLCETIHEVSAPLCRSKKRYPVDQETLAESAYYGALLYEFLAGESAPMEEWAAIKDVEEDRARMRREGAAFYCARMNEILEKKTLEKADEAICLCPDLLPKRREIEAWFLART